MGKPLELMAEVKHFQVDTLPVSPEANAYYNLRIGFNRFRQYITDSNGDYIEQSDFFVDETLSLSTNRDFTETDNLKLIANTSDSDLVLTIPVDLPDNWIAFCENSGTGSIEIVADPLVYLKGDAAGFVEENSFTLNESPGALYLRHLGSNQYVIIGNID